MGLKKFIVAIALAFSTTALAEPRSPEPKNVTELRKQFFDDIKSQGGDVSKCKVDYVDDYEGHPVVIASCKFKPLVCVVLMHKTEPAFFVEMSDCMPNPDFIAEENKI